VSQIVNACTAVCTVECRMRYSSNIYSVKKEDFMSRLKFFVASIVAMVVFCAVSSTAYAGKVPTKDANSYAKDACKEWAKVSNKLPTTQKEFTNWISSASKATAKAIPKAASAAKRDKKWNTFLANLIFVQGELKYLSSYRQFSNARQWDASVGALKSTCYIVLAK
jgi:hypothetical protein